MLPGALLSMNCAVYGGVRGSGGTPKVVAKPGMFGPDTICARQDAPDNKAAAAKRMIFTERLLTKPPSYSKLLKSQAICMLVGRGLPGSGVTSG